MKPDSAYKVPTTPEEFFASFLRFLKPLHGLSERQIQLASAFLAIRHELSKKITDDELLDANVLSTEVKKKIRSKLGLNRAQFQVTLGDLRKNGFIKENRFNPKFIPNFPEGSKPKGFTLMFYFPFEYPNEQPGEETVQ